MQQWLTKCIDFIFPSRCVSCGARNELLCERCIAHVPQCPRPLNKVTSVFSYNSPIMRKAIWALKYSHGTQIAPILASHLYDKILEELSEEGVFHSFTQPLLIPIPLHAHKKRQRGYNQSELICNALSLKDSVSFTMKTDVLYRHLDTPSQAHTKSKKERAQNIRGCFKVKNPHEVRGKNIILIDDVVTTGATLAEASRTLKKAGARRVISFTVAH